MVLNRSQNQQGRLQSVYGDGNVLSTVPSRHCVNSGTGLRLSECIVCFALFSSALTGVSTCPTCLRRVREKMSVDGFACVTFGDCLLGDRACHDRYDVRTHSQGHSFSGNHGTCKVITWNCQGIAADYLQEGISDLHANSDCDVVCLQETLCNDDINVDAVPDFYCFFERCGLSDAQRTVSILIHRRLYPQDVYVCKGFRCISVSFRVGAVQYHVISSHLPHKGFPAEWYESCLNCLTTLIATIRHRRPSQSPITLVGLDANASFRYDGIRVGRRVLADPADADGERDCEAGGGSLSDPWMVMSSWSAQRGS
eukprot:TRINITY_DN8053_c0_g1_i1.p1 TRINITY_DN8053_c0_g1~~TRINITY_DN8053_c0_g1_i1.p1  ORF type:complete len:323 (-),score=-10.41 TRINITY_DN8053_c0_g1_i1:90-1025(-)